MKCRRTIAKQNTNYRENKNTNLLALAVLPAGMIEVSATLRETKKLLMHTTSDLRI
jgi:hypothetical protein